MWTQYCALRPIQVASQVHDQRVEPHHIQAPPQHGTIHGACSLSLHSLGSRIEPSHEYAILKYLFSARRHWSWIRTQSETDCEAVGWPIGTALVSASMLSPSLDSAT